MKSIILTATLVCLYSVGYAANFYFSSSSGDDNRTSTAAQNPSTPWRSLQKLNVVFSQLAGGDTVFLRRGDVFDGSILVTRSGQQGRPLVIAAYGSGSKPVINGFRSLTAFVNEGAKIWSAAWTGKSPNLLLLDGKQQPLGRYPNPDGWNSGYLTFESFTGTTAITDNELTSAVNWTGGEVVIRKNRWIIDRCPIINHSGRTIFYTNTSQYQPVNNFGYFIQNHLKALDRHGEWAIDRLQQKLFVFLNQYTAGSTSVRVSGTDSLLALNNRSFVTIRDLHFTGANENAITINDGRHVTVTGCDFTHTGFNGVLITNSTNVVVENSVFEYNNNNAVATNYNCRNIRVNNNQITKTGIYPGMGRSGDLNYQAITAVSDNSVVEYNRIDSTGYIPIRFEGDSCVVQNNFITNFLFVKDDGGGIYTWNNGANARENKGRLIRNNIVMHGIGAGDGTNLRTRRNAHSVYLDDNVAGVTISGNTMAFCAESGLYMRNSRKIIIRNNVVFNNGLQLNMQHDRVSANNPLRNIEVINNIVFSRSASQLLMSLRTIRDDVALFGVPDSNYFCRPLNDKPYFFTSYTKSDNEYVQAYDLESWRGALKKDSSSRPSPVQVLPYRLNELKGSNKISNATFTTNVQNVIGFAVSGSYRLDWEKSSKMDDGCLRVSFDSSRNNRALVIMNVGTLEAGKPYVVRFSAMGSLNYKSLSVFLRNAASPFTTVSEVAYARINNFRTENELLLVSTATVASGAVVFDISDQNCVWMDNIQVQEAAITAVNPDDLFLFEYNASTDPRTITLTEPYIDAKSNSFTGSVVIPPYSSVVLLKKAYLDQSTLSLALEGSREAGGISLNWLTKSVRSANLFEVQRSDDGTRFRTISFQLAEPTANRDSYTFLDTSAIRTIRAFYRIKQVQPDNSFFYSNSIEFAREGLAEVTLFPNPARTTLSVYFRNPPFNENVPLQVFNSLGQLVGTYTLLQGNSLLTIPVGKLQAGVYYLSVNKKQYAFIKTL